jgi:ergothioneine biosynthesis protein EgtB
MRTEAPSMLRRHDVAADRYASVRNLTECLASPLSPEDQTIQSMPDVSPTKWHRAHTTWFFETFVLGLNDPTYSQFHPRYEYLFNSYYEAVGPRHPRAQRGLLSRPGAADITRYRCHVDAAMERFIEQLDEDSDADALAGLVELGLHHEQQHQELLLMDIKHVLSVNPLQPAYREDLVIAVPSPNPTLRWTEHEGGLVEIGHDGNGFAFDNESPRHTTYLQPFAIAERPVTCGDWLEFIADDGYERSELWLSDGWALRNSEGWCAPSYWSREGNEWTVFTLGGPKPLDPAEPVCHISYHEADAYAHWRGARLPTEAEWEAVAASQRVEGNFLDMKWLHPRAAEEAVDGPKFFGDVWEWTASAYLPYPGFQAAAGAVGEYNGKFMVNQHVLRGGCCATPPGHTRATYRNFFPPASRWAFTGARLAKDVT